MKERKIGNQSYGQLLSHRARISGFPENNIEGFKEVLKTGVKFIELDVRISKDKTFFLNHSPFVFLGFKKINLIEKTFEEINNL